MQATPARNHADDLRSATVSAVMTKAVLSCAPDADLAEMASAMSSARVHCLFVDLAESDGPRWAVVSDLDLVAAAAAGRASAGQVAASPTVTVTPADSLLHAAELMRDYQTAHLVVVDAGDARPVGVLSTLDVADSLAAAR